MVSGNIFPVVVYDRTPFNMTNKSNITKRSENRFLHPPSERLNANPFFHNTGSTLNPFFHAIAETCKKFVRALEYHVP